MAESKKKNLGIEIDGVPTDESNVIIEESAEETAARIAEKGFDAVVPVTEIRDRTLRVYREKIGEHTYSFKYPGIRIKNDIFLEAQAGGGRVDVNMLYEGYCKAVIVAPKMTLSDLDKLSADEQKRLLFVCDNIFNGNFDFR